MYKKVEKLMQDRGVTAYRVAKDLGFSYSLFPRWRDGIATPKIDKIKQICDYFNVPITYFYEDFGDE